ncbi:MAG: tRNA lysidine(34) synthetase TilS [Thermoleophilia bacterium]|nr:tRNA lysidine(34) synthetase TilS [Thermoleophilia bacterium]
MMVSGGQDSLALLHLLATGSLRRAGPVSLQALHINHHLRGDESDADEALVVRSCAGLGVGLTVVHRKIDKQAGAVQEAARDARREAALQVACEQECHRIALGHTADDQVETMLYRLGRYGGMAAFAAMRSCDPPWVRPLLECRRAETADYCESHGLEYARDRGNAHPGYARTGIRERVLPAWEDALPGAVEAACRASEVAAELVEVVAAVLAEAAPGLDEAEELSVRTLQGLEPSLRRAALHRWMERRAKPAASRAGVLAIESLLDSPGSAERSLSGGWRACKEYDRLFLARARRGERSGDDGCPPHAPVRLTVPGVARWGDVTVCAEPVDAYMPPDVSREAYVDADSLEGCLEVRGPRQGDRLRPFGAPGTRKLQDVLVDLRVPARERARVPLVTCDGRIIWVGGLLVAEGGRIGESTTAVVRLSLERQKGRSANREPAGEGRGGRG